MFRASQSFTDCIQSSLPEGLNAHKDIKFLPDKAFYKSVCLILCDLFGYRAEMSQEHFFKMGSTERKIVMALQIYDILK